jgi:TonB family protein
MKTLAHFSVWLAISICLSLFVREQTSSSGPLQQNASKDSLTIQTESTNTNAFKFLPKYNQEKDTAGFKLIPKHYDDSDFVPYDKEPQIVKKVEPTYPERAKRTRLEGKVIVKLWIDKDGKVKRAVVLKSDAEIFNESAIEAAKQFVFTPAYLNNEPVAVWVSYPFRFQLPDTK